MLRGRNVNVSHLSLDMTSVNMFQLDHSKQMTLPNGLSQGEGVPILHSEVFLRGEGCILLLQYIQVFAREAAAGIRRHFM